LRAISRWTLAVLVALAGASVAGWAVISHSVDRQDRAVVQTDADQIQLVLQTALQNLQTELRSLSFFTTRSGYSPRIFAEQAKPLLTSRGVTVALINISGAQPRVVLAIGPDLRPGRPLPAALGRAARGAGLGLASGIVRTGGRTLLYLEAAPSTDPTVVGLEVSRVTPTVPALNRSGPYSKVYLTLYEGRTAAPGRLILTTFGRGRLPTPVAKSVVRFGSLTWLVEVGPKAAPSGAFTEATPWLALAVGLVVTVLLAAVVETLNRRREQAEKLAAERDLVAEENRRLYTQQRTLAETLQAALLPEALPDLAVAETAVRYLPGVEGINVGGDWYDLIPLDDAHVLAVVGDVSGRGLRAAAVMASLLYATRAYAAEGDSPVDILAKLSKILNVGRSGQFATVLLVLMDLQAHRITVVNGGHPPPLLLTNGTAHFVDSDVGVPIGVSSTPAYNPTTIPVTAGTTLLAYTDGLVERRGESLDVGFERLRDVAVRSENGSLDGLLSAVVESLVGSGAVDDTVLLGVRWRD
jgi:serine phosphatase RsbU (regulator of sigma subunit)